jgi:energy-coupling factor transporter transmembrane protein EcfT
LSVLYGFWFPLVIVLSVLYGFWFPLVIVLSVLYGFWFPLVIVLSVLYVFWFKAKIHKELCLSHSNILSYSLINSGLLGTHYICQCVKKHLKIPKGQSKAVKSKKDRQWNDQMEIDKNRNKDLQNTTQKTNDWATRNVLKEDNEWLCIFFSRVAILPVSSICRLDLGTLLFGAPEFIPAFSTFRVAQSLVFCVVFCRSLFLFLSISIWSFHCLSFFDFTA